MTPKNIVMPRLIISLLIITAAVQGQESDSLKKRVPKKAALYALLFPGGGQYYNRRPMKAALLLSAAAGSARAWSVNASNYRNYEENMALPKHRYLEKRNKYAWWIGFIYIYGLLDAVVDAHLQPFEEIMNEDLESKETKEKE